MTTFALINIYAALFIYKYKPRMLNIALFYLLWISATAIDLILYKEWDKSIMHDLVYGLAIVPIAAYYWIISSLK